MSAAVASVLVLGVGNPLRGDDGVGGRVIAELRDRRAAGAADVPADVELVEAGAPGPELLPWLAGAAGAVIVDAIVAGGTPGTVTVWRDGEAAGVHARADELGLDDLLATARLARCLPQGVSVIGVEAGSLEPALTLGRDVEAALPAAVAATLAEIGRLRALANPDDRMEVRS